MMQSERVRVLQETLTPDGMVNDVVYMWDRYKTNMEPKLSESKELRDFVFATDTSTTSNADLGEFAWKNNTHLPKLCEIRDNLLAIYKANWFPNDFWMKWQAFSQADETKEKKEVIEAYMRNKVRMSNFEGVVGEDLATDYIDYGNAFCAVTFVDNNIYDKNGQVEKAGYVGPAPCRISPEDIVFDLTAKSFKDSPKVIRSLYTIGDMVLMAKMMEKDNPEKAKAIMDAVKLRGHLTTSGTYSKDDFNKVESFRVDGFGNYWEYLNSSTVEILEFRGTMYNHETGEVLRDHVVQVMDRRVLIHKGPWESWMRDGGVYHVGYRKRPDNLWHMGPLDNLVGMQYRIDHLQGAKDDNIDLHLHPTKVIIGDPDETDVGPNREIRLSEGESIQFISPDLSPMQLDTEIQYLLQLMEEFVGSPKQSRGFRTPGEKTLGEVNLLEVNANRLFLDKAIKFEKELIEPLLNGMLEAGRRNLRGKEAVQVFDDSLGVFVFLDITEKDLQADGLLVPIGARHFGQRNQQLQNIINLYNSGLGPKVDPHISGEALASLVRDNLQLGQFGIISPYSALYEQGEMASVQQQVERNLQEQAAADVDGDIDEPL